MNVEFLREKVCSAASKKAESSKMEEVAKEEKPGVVIYGNSRLSDRITAFQQKAEHHKTKQLSNPFSGHSGSGSKTQHDINDPNYGRPVAGSKTDLRGKAAAVSIGKEVQELCRIIQEYGEDQGDGTYEITFKELFDMYQVISNKVVGVLLRARKHGLLHFEGEMLFQRRDDGVIITLLVDPGSIEQVADSASCIK